MMREVILRQVWFVYEIGADGEPQLWDTKMDAETYVRVLFPDEDADKRHSRICAHNVYTIKHNDTERTLNAEEMVRVLHVRTSRLNSEQGLDKV